MTDWRSIPMKDIDWRMLHARFWLIGAEDLRRARAALAEGDPQ